MTVTLPAADPTYEYPLLCSWHVYAVTLSHPATDPTYEGNMALVFPDLIPLNLMTSYALIFQPVS